MLWSIVLMLVGVGCLGLAGEALFWAGPWLGQWFISGPYPRHWREPERRPFLILLLLLGVAGMALWGAGWPLGFLGTLGGEILGGWRCIRRHDQLRENRWR